MVRRFLRFAISIAGASSLVWGVQSFNEAPTLQEVLRRNQIDDVRQLSRDLLNMPITSYSAEGDGREFAIAFFQAKPGNGLEPPIHIVLLDRAPGKWQHATITLDDAIGVGSITSVKRTPRYIYLDSHINPSAGRLIVLSRDLKLRKALYGREVASFGIETLVYEHSEIHFAPTHFVEMSVFNAGTLEDKQIYPPKPFQPVRKEFIERVSQAYKQRGEEWFRINNHYMDPELFDSSAGEVTVAVSAKTIEFLVVFGDPPRSRGDDYPVSFSEQVVVTCGPMDRVAQTECRERRLDEWRQALRLPNAPSDEVVKRAAGNPTAVR
jgi:hypothetical protein